MKARAKYFCVDNLRALLDFGSYGLLMYYAKQLNSALGRKLYDATLTEYQYRVQYDLPVGNYIDVNDASHFVISDLQDVIDFIENDLIPALNSESDDIIDKFGGVSYFIDLFYIEPAYLEHIGLIETEYFQGDGSQLAAEIKAVKNIFQYSLSQGQPYNIDIH